MRTNDTRGPRRAPLLRALGWGLVRILISGLAGVGLAMLLVGRAEANRPGDWPRYTPPPGMPGSGAESPTKKPATVPLAAGLLLPILFPPSAIRDQQSG